MKPVDELVAAMVACLTDGPFRSKGFSALRKVKHVHTQGGGRHCIVVCHFGRLDAIDAGSVRCVGCCGSVPQSGLSQLGRVEKSARFG